MYKITLQLTEAQIKRLKEKGAWPFPCGGVLFDDGTIHQCDDLSPFYRDPRYPELGYDERLLIEEIKEPYGETDDSEV